MWWFASRGNWLLVGFVVGAVLGMILGLLTCFICNTGLGELGYLGPYFIIDSVVVVFGLLTLLIFCVLYLSGVSSLWIYVSIISALFSYMCVHALVFWFFYELSIVCALFLLLYESPYPERYKAGWYLGGYILLSSIPLLVSIIILSLFNGCCYIHSWDSSIASELHCLQWLICVVFMTKIPVPPFHVWLPLVHAEASSATSIILSGYIMKLGVLGLVRFGASVLNSNSVMSLLLFVCTFGLLFILSSYRECDAKRWLAMMSLFHILVSVVLCVCGTPGQDVGFLYYCFGHGLSTSSMFMLVWWGYSYINSRNWSLLVYVLGGVLSLQTLTCIVFFCVAGFPPTPQFMSELLMIVASLGVDGKCLLIVLGLYIFGGGLVAFVVLGYIVCSMGIVGGVARYGQDKYLMSALFMSLFNLLVVLFF